MLLLADKSWESDESMVDTDTSSMDDLGHKLTSTNKVKVVVEEAGTDHDHDHDQEEIRSSRSICKYCGKEFKSGKALGGHVRIHSQQQYHYQAAAAAAAGASNKQYNKYHTRRAQEDQDNCLFACFVCGESFESIRLLCHHSRNHRDPEDEDDDHDHHNYKENHSNTTTKDDDDEQPTLESEDSSFLGKPLAEEEVHTNGDVEYYDEQNQNHGCGSEDLLQPLPKWGRKRSRVLISGGGAAYQDEDVDDKVHDATPLRFYYGPQVATSERRLPTTTTNTNYTMEKKKLKIQDASMESKPKPSDHGHQSTDNDKVYNAIPLRFYYGPEVAASERRLPTPTTMEKKKKKVKTDGEFNSPNGDASMESKSQPNCDHSRHQSSDDSESTVQLFGCLIKKSNNDTPNSTNMQSAQGIEASSSHGDEGRRRRRRRWKKDEERVHQCDMCGKIFDTGHALGGHMTYHRMRDGGGVGGAAAASFRLVQRKPKPQAVSRELDHHSFVQFRIEEHVEPEAKTVVLDFDLNIPYQE